jgi:hypothetical protein
MGLADVTLVAHRRALVECYGRSVNRETPELAAFLIEPLRRFARVKIEAIKA